MMRYESLEQRLLFNSIVVGECWIWIGRKGGHGYGRINVRLNGKHVTLWVHRLAYEVFNDEKIPDGETVDHLCETLLCINPAHLRLVSRSINSSLRHSRRA